MKAFSFALPKQQKDRLNTHKSDTGLTYAEIIRRAIDQYLMQNEASRSS